LNRYMDWWEQAQRDLEKARLDARYPNGFPSGKPADYYNERKAREALSAAEEIHGFYRANLPS